MFNQAFSWLELPTPDLMFPNQLVDMTQYEEAKQVASDLSNAYLSQYRALKFNASAPRDAVEKSHKDFLRSKRYIDFLDECAIFLQDAKNHSQSIYLLMLKISLKSTEKSFEQSTILSAWLKQAPDEALHFCQSCLESRLGAVNSESEQGAVMIRLGKICVDYCLDDFRLKLKYQEQEPLALCHLLPSLIEMPFQFAAGIIWMIEKGISINDLIETRILDRFLTSYLLEALEFQNNNPKFNMLSFFYGLLDQFEYAKPLVELSKQVSCNIRGFQSYNLLGQKENSLKLKSTQSELPNLIRTIENLEHLLTVFGEKGLVILVNTLFKGFQNNEKLDEFDVFFVNCVKKHQLHFITPELIQNIAEEHPEYLIKWVHFIDDKLFMQWVQKKKPVVLYLLPYKPQLTKHIDLSIASSFLQEIISQHLPGFQIQNVRLLIELYRLTLERNMNELSKHIYEVLFDLVLTHPSLLEDGYLFRTLRQSPYILEVVDRKEKALLKALEGDIDLFLQRPLDFLGYQQLKKDWNSLLLEVETLMELRKCKTFPQNEIALIVSIFQSYSSKSDPSWELLMNAVEINSSHVIAILEKVDHAELRGILLSFLGWNQKTFLSEHREALLNGVRYGNVGLINWYLDKNFLDEELFHQAVDSKQWLLLNSWLKRYETFSELGLSEKTINYFLMSLIESKTNEFSHVLMTKSGLSFSTKIISRAFILAAKKHDERMLRDLYLLSKESFIFPLSLKAAFAQAIESKNDEALTFFSKIRKEIPQLVLEVEHEFRQSIKHLNLSRAERLMHFYANAPSIKVLQDEMRKSKNPEVKQCLEEELSKRSALLSRKEEHNSRTRLPTHPSCWSTDFLDACSPLLRSGGDMSSVEVETTHMESLVP